MSDPVGLVEADGVGDTADRERVAVITDVLPDDRAPDGALPRKERAQHLARVHLDAPEGVPAAIAQATRLPIAHRAARNAVAVDRMQRRPPTPQ